MEYLIVVLVIFMTLVVGINIGLRLRKYREDKRSGASRKNAHTDA